MARSQLKAVLAGGLPVDFGFVVYSPFESEAVAKTGIVPMPAEHDYEMGGHSVLLVGYDDRAQTFLVRNSWGTGWGIDGTGYFTLPYPYLEDPTLSSSFRVVQHVPG